MTLDWRGDAIKAKVAAASRAATSETIDVAIGDAQANTPVLTGAARDSVRTDGLEQANGVTSAVWGYHVAYGIWIEIGARGRAGVHALRGAADRAYRDHLGRIKARLG